MQVEVQALSKRFGGLQAVDQVSLSARGGEVTAVIGPNGAGKSTLLDCLSGITPFDSGAVVIDGNRWDTGLRERLVEIGITRTFQNLRLFPTLTLEEHLRLARASFLRCARAKSNQARTRELKEACRAILDRVGLSHKAAMLPRELSYGEQRRLEIARGLATEPHLFLLDEPAAGSTPAERERMAELLQAIVAEGRAVILVEHHIELVGRVSSQIVVLNFGKVIASGSIADVRSNPEVIKAYLGTEVH